jgi:hypothetical protein
MRRSLRFRLAAALTGLIATDSGGFRQAIDEPNGSQVLRVLTHSIQRVLIGKVDDYQGVAVCWSVVRAIANLFDARNILEEMVHFRQHLIDDFTPHIRLNSQDHLMPNHLSSCRLFFKLVQI